MSHVSDQAADATLAVAAVSAPFWLEAVTNGLHIYITIGGAVLLTLRIAKAVRAFKSKEDI